MNNSGAEWVAQMTPVERHAELVYAESLYEKVSSSPASTYKDINMAAGRAYLVSSTLETGLHSSRKCEYPYFQV